MSFRIPTEQAGRLLDEVVQTGLTQISGVSFVASDETIANAHKQALKKSPRMLKSKLKLFLAV